MWLSFGTASWLYGLANIGLIIGLIIGVISTALVVWTGKIKEEYLSKELANSKERTAALEKLSGEAKIAIAAANERAGEAEQKAAEAKLALQKFKEPRRLSSEQHAVLVKKLKQFAGTEYDLAAKDSEPLDFALDIERALRDAGWTIRSWTDGGIFTNLPGRDFVVGHVVLDGVDVQMRDPSLSSVRDAFVNALEISGFEGVRGSAANASPEDPNRGVLHIMIGTKP